MPANLSTPSLGITRAGWRPRLLAGQNKLSTPSLGITRSSRRPSRRAMAALCFQLPLSGSRILKHTINQLWQIMYSFQLPLSGSRSGTGSLTGSRSLLTLSTPSLGITIPYSQPLIPILAKLSTPSLGITRGTSRGASLMMAIGFQLPLSGSHACQSLPFCERRRHFQLPLSGSPTSRKFN